MSSPAEPGSLFVELGGEAALRRIVDRFVDRLFADLMVGFLFQRANRERIKEKEYEFAAQHLGAPLEYTGRSIEAAHRVHRIFDGQFLRRLTILRETLEEFGVPQRVREHWLNHTISLRDQVVVGNCAAPPPDDAPP